MNKFILKSIATSLIVLLVVIVGVKFKQSTPITQIEKSYLANLEKLEKNSNLSYEEIKKLSKLDRPDMAFMQDFEMTMDPRLGYPPIERRMVAFNKIKETMNSRVEEFAVIPNVQWVERGPTNVAGRTRALMFDPNDGTSKKVWAGAIGGGLWFNDDITNAQSQWQNVGDMMANLAISSLVYDPTNTQVFYMGTGLGYTSDIQGDGIFKSTDGGASWTQIANTISNTDFQFVQKIVVTSLGTVIATTRSGTFRSTDGGDSWTDVQSGRMGDIEIASDNDIYITQGVNSAGAIFKSTDDGVTWTDITPASGRRIEITSAPSNPNVLFAVADGGSGGTDVAWFKKSTDGGTTWTDVAIPNYVSQDCSISNDHFTRGQAFFDLILAVHPTNENIVIAGGVDLHKSVDGGTTWEGVSYWTGSSCDDYVHADQHEIVFRPGYPNEAIFGTDGGVSYSADVGNSNNPEFEDRNNGYNVTTFYSAAALNEVNSNYFLAGAQDNGTQQFTEPGLGNTRQVTGGDGAYCFIDQDNGDIQISSYVFNSYFLSQDDGLSFVTISNDQSLGRFINPTEYDDDTDILYGAGGVDQYTRIDDLSGTPTALQTINTDFGGRQITTIKKSPYMANRLFVGVRISTGEGDIFIVDDAHTSNPTITKITGTYTGSHGGWISSIDVGASDDQLLATFSNYGVSSVYETMDGGVNWTDKNDNLPDIPVRYGLYNPVNRNQVLLATELGVWSTNNLSATNPNWEATNSGLANVRCDMLKYRSSDQLVIVATYGRGLFTSNVFATTVDANFKTNQIVGYVGVPVQFTDASLLPNGDWSWNFGDGSGTSTAQSPLYTYTMAGTYDVSLTIDGGADIETKIEYITILPLKSTPYLASQGGDFETNPDDFTSKSLLNGINHWERGVPTNQITTVNSGVNAWKTDLDTNVDDKGFDYISALYTPAFDFSNADKNYKVSFRKSISTVFCNAPQAMQLQYSIDGGNIWVRLGSSFQEYGAVNWYNRGDNTGCSIRRSIFTDKMGWSASNVAGGTDNTVHNENTEFSLNNLAGQTNVSFRFVSSVGSGSSAAAYEGDGFMIDDFEILTSDPTADFDTNVTSVYIGQDVVFTSRSVGVQTYIWDFGDGTPVSTDSNPVHNYTSAGSYTVSLTISSTVGNDTQSKTDYISVLPKKGSSYTLAEGGDFESNVTDFSVQHIGGTPFELGESSVTGKDGTSSGINAWVTGIADNEYLDHSESRLLTPSFDFTNLGQYVFEFKSKFIFEDKWDGFIVEYSTDFGIIWIKLNPVMESGWYTTVSDVQSVFGASVPIFSGSTNGTFETFSTDVSFLAGNSDVAFRFKFLSDANTVDVGMALDDFILSGPQTGPAVPDFSMEGNTGCEGQVVTFTNASTGSISSMDWDFGANATPATASGVGPFNVTYSGSGTSTVTLTLLSPENGTQIESKVDAISTAPNHLPTFIEEAVAGNDAQTNLVASSGNGYQWLMNSDSIEGATQQTYLAVETASYSVLVDVDGCAVKSETSFLITALNDDSFAKSISVYPNPASGNLYIDVSNDFKGNMTLEIYNVYGKQFYSSVVYKDRIAFTKEIPVSNFNRGIYFVELQFEERRVVRKIIIE
ncbi:MAG: PKD domain-containing protein [Cyclobacteriaceae bacterium]|nr:PKD domain-containing protein [Cyclobacteriaceae bacterium]